MESMKQLPPKYKYKMVKIRLYRNIWEIVGI
jgi:hypothetical protein